MFIYALKYKLCVCVCIYIFTNLYGEAAQNSSEGVDTSEQCNRRPRYC